MHKVAQCQAWASAGAANDDWAAFRRWAHGLSNLVIVCNLRREIEWVNPAFTRVTGWRSGQAIGMRPGCLLQGPRTDPHTVERIRRALDAGQGISGVELLNYTRDRRTYWISLSIQPWFDASGKLSRLVAVQGELPVHRRAHEDLLASEERFRMMAELSVDWYWEQDDQYRYTDISPGFERPSGLSREQVLGRTRWELFPDALSPSQWAAHRRMLDGRDEFRGLELRVRRGPGGKDMWISVSGRPRYVDGAFAGYHGVACDVSAHKRSRLALRDANAQLERRVAQRTAELQNANEELKLLTQRLEQARLQAEAASVDKSQLLATMSHEIRSPMSGVLGSLELLQSTSLNERQATLVGAALGSGESLMSLLNEVLDLSKMEAGHLGLDERPFSLGGVAEPVVELFQANAMGKQVHLSCHLELGDCDELIGDAQRLRQVLVNLVGNAIKFTPRGEVELRITACPWQGGTAHLRFEVRDSGVGIPEDVLPRLFQPYMQADNPGLRPRHGTGLGLSISQRIVEAMGGRIEARRRAQGGTVFSFELRLPRARCHAARRATVGSRGVDERVADGAIVLVVEDSPVNRMVAVEMLSSLGAQVHEAENGQEALEAVAARAYDLIFMDCEMPEMDGYAATQRIREREVRQSQARTPIVALSANAYAEDVHRAHRCGMDGHLAKPYTREQLAAALREWLVVGAAVAG